MGSDDRWQVRMAPGEVKVLTLDQIDDLFRLELIDEDTLITQEGTEQWRPLRVVAGLDDEEASEQAPSPAPPPVASAPPPVASAPPPVASAPPPVASAPPPVASAPSPVGSALPPVRSAPPPAANVPPPPPAPLPAPASAPLPPPWPSAVMPFGHSPSFVPPGVKLAVTSVSPSAPAPSAPAPSVAPPFVAKVVPLQVTPPEPLSRTSRPEQLLIGLAALLGLLLVLQRNGVLAALFASAGQQAAYASLESALGGPGFGTPRAVDALVRTTTRTPAAH
jgi:hypothetical protein